MNTVIVGCGWLGMPLAEALSSEGYTVTGTKRSLPGKLPGFPMIVFDTKNPNAAATAIFQQADWIVLALTPDREKIEGYTEDCMKIAEMAGKDTRFLMISSTSVYSDELTIAREEDADQLHPNKLLLAENALRKLLAERLTIIRMAGLAGNDRWPVNMMIRSGKTYNGSDPVNLIHQQDAVGICQFVIKNNLTGELINACSGNHPAKEAYYTWMAEQFSLPAPLFRQGAKGKIIDSERSRRFGYRYKKDDPYGFMED